MDSTVINAILSALPAPAITAGVVMLAGAVVPGSGRRVLAVRRLTPGLAIGVGMVVGYALKGTGGWPVPPGRFEHWVAIVGAFAAVVSFWAAVMPSGPAWRWGMRALASFAVSAGISWRLARESWSVAEAVFWIGGTGLGIMLAWAAFDRIASSRAGGGEGDGIRGRSEGENARVMPGWCGPLLLSVWAGMASQALAATDSLLLGSYGAMVAASAGALVVGAVVRRTMDVAGGGARGGISGGGVVAMLTGILVFGGHHYSGLALWMALMVMAGPVFAAVLDRLMLGRVSGLPRAAWRMAALGVLPGVVLGVAIPAAIRAANDLGY
ncbi:MAG: hypothetical protein KF787_11790 [Phycisphaeraceae bacterium]|nr:hypothetical protein [Phycisphaerae bacterium]MBX3393316.1 hypothetical protein [Phycisphaeraceae bacterium]